MKRGAAESWRQKEPLDCNICSFDKTPCVMPEKITHMKSFYF